MALGQKKKIAILGGVGSGTIVAQAIADLAKAGSAITCAGYLNDRVQTGDFLGNLPVIGPFDAWRDLPAEVMLIPAIHKVGDMKNRIARIEALGIPEERFASVIHPSACIADDTSIAGGTYVGPHAVIMPGARVGRRTSLRAGCYISHDVELEDWCFVGPNTVVSGRSRLDTAAYLGPGVNVREETFIGRYATVGLGSVVIRDIPAKKTVAGNPARELNGSCRDNEQ